MTTLPVAPDAAPPLDPLDPLTTPPSADPADAAPTADPTSASLAATRAGTPEPSPATTPAPAPESTRIAADPNRPPLAIIAGTGFADLDTLTDRRAVIVDTEFGAAALTHGRWHGLPVIFLARHGADHTVPPHRINHRANLRALRDAGCRDVLAVNVTGGIDPELATGDLLCLHDFLDLTKSGPVTFFDGDTPEGVVHTDMTHAYHPDLRRELLEAAARIEQPMRPDGVYACFSGPRFESPAEIRLAGLAGGDVVGMTGVPEVTLAVETGLRYAAISLVVNPAAGVGASTEPITLEAIEATLNEGAPRILAVLDELVRARAEVATEAGDGPASGPGDGPTA